VIKMSVKSKKKARIRLRFGMEGTTHIGNSSWLRACLKVRVRARMDERHADCTWCCSADVGSLAISAEAMVC
jgi:hypothetical protein